jgi:hypothetical protein
MVKRTDTTPSLLSASIPTELESFEGALLEGLAPDEIVSLPAAPQHGAYLRSSMLERGFSTLKPRVVQYIAKTCDELKLSMFCFLLLLYYIILFLFVCGFIYFSPVRFIFDVHVKCRILN